MRAPAAPSSGLYDEAAIAHAALESTVVVVSDDLGRRQVVTKSFLGLGLHVVQSRSSSALRAVMEHRPGLVVLDASVAAAADMVVSLGAVSSAPVLRLAGSEPELPVASSTGSESARVRNVLRRRGFYRDEFVTVDFGNRSVWTEAQGEVSLTRQEFDLLAAFVQHPNQLLTSRQLLRMVWGDRTGHAAHRVTIYVSYLRRRLSPSAPGEVPIITRRGVGYEYSSRALRTGAAARSYAERLRLFQTSG